MKKRSATFRRETKETLIDISLDLDGEGRTQIETGIPFFNHMLDQLGRHGNFDLNIEAKGDLEIDAHHTVCLLYTSPSPRDLSTSRMPSSA